MPTTLLPKSFNFTVFLLRSFLEGYNLVSMVSLLETVVYVGYLKTALQDWEAVGLEYICMFCCNATVSWIEQSVLGWSKNYCLVLVVSYNMGIKVCLVSKLPLPADQSRTSWSTLWTDAGFITLCFPGFSTNVNLLLYREKSAWKWSSKIFILFAYMFYLRPAHTVKFSRWINAVLSVIDTVCNHTTSWTFYFCLLPRKTHFTMLEWKVVISVCYQYLLYCQILWCIESTVSRVRLPWTARQRASKTVHQSEKILSTRLLKSIAFLTIFLVGLAEKEQ